MFKTKHDAKGQVERYKVRLVAKGYNQQEGIDFKETFSPFFTKYSLCIIMAIVAHFDLELHQMDVRTTFLNRDLVEDVYMSQPLRRLVKKTWFVSSRIHLWFKAGF